MPKLKDQKTNPLDEVSKRIEKYVETYDSPLMHDPVSNLFKTENQIKHETGTLKQSKNNAEYNRIKHLLPKQNKIDDYELYKSVASPTERKEFEQIEERSKPLKERKVYKAKMAALDAQLKQSLLTPIPTTVTQPEPKNNFLNDLAAERKDPDLFRGLGTFLHKKI